MLSQKYGRTYHFPFSPGTTSDDRIQYDYWNCVQAMDKVVHTEKLDGENNCINRHGVFARSHAAPTRSPWTASLRERWALLKNDLGDLELFGENLYTIHSIRYTKLEQHYFVFAVRDGDQWLSWEEVAFYAAAFDLPTVPVLAVRHKPTLESVFCKEVMELASADSLLGTAEQLTGLPCTREGVVSRNEAGFPVDQLHRNVFKYVRKGHVQTTEHWTRSWQRAPLLHELINKKT